MKWKKITIILLVLISVSVFGFEIKTILSKQEIQNLTMQEVNDNIQYVGKEIELNNGKINISLSLKTIIEREKDNFEIDFKKVKIVINENELQTCVSDFNKAYCFENLKKYILDTAKNYRASEIQKIEKIKKEKSTIIKEEIEKLFTVSELNN